MKTIIKIIGCVLLVIAAAKTGVALGTACHDWAEARATEVYHVKHIEHVVRSGETLWGIAERYVELDQRHDSFDEFMGWVYQENNARIYPGDVVKIRYYIEK